MLREPPSNSGKKSATRLRCVSGWRGHQRRHPGIRKLAAEAEAWVRCDSHGWPFTFASICDVLGLNVDDARARFLAEGEYLTGGDARAHHFRNLRAARGTTSGPPCARCVARRVMWRPIAPAARAG
jgi:hypothetical protein